MAKENTQNNSGNDNAGKEEDKKDNKPKTKKNNLVVVRFKRSYTPYIKGEKAGLGKDEAKKLIEMEVCEKA
ncbi:MAG: hypothetical protein J7L15_05650 [Clostridiales bacterium]|nr:hypothetical protein [Clostridiales bacterium]